MSHIVDFVTVSTQGLESSPFADALAGLRANEARYFRNKYDHVFTVTPAAEAARLSSTERPTTWPMNASAPRAARRWSG